MNTELLIAQLAEDLHPVPPGASRAHLRNGLIAGAAIAAAGVVFWPSLGVRHDLGAAMTTGIFWIKLLYTGSLAYLGFQALDRLSRPGSRPVDWTRLLAVPLVALAAATLLRLGVSPADSGDAFWMGSSWAQCPLYVAGLSIPVFFGLLWGISRLAPTQLTAAGAAAGLVAGGTGATVYALHCTESSPGFVLLWYTLGLAAASLIGAAVGPKLLRW
ncbi:hypothetical protein AX777_17615 [Sphingobium yanoikuyae]|jgi:hypothetical protein|uniref:DUF1109 domain-containing protein n=1 Tax=Sphingobium yanoikuyae TaxID=13690 RepID=A0A177JX77_SPHYA|nr:DUF1109 domain-containing protein [Sphingobium yanoikuyae]OAH45426.1 hypothetical protein AX777_17615 [Sphingobium yanoikuyae]